MAVRLQTPLDERGLFAPFTSAAMPIGICSGRIEIATSGRGRHRRGRSGGKPPCRSLPSDCGGACPRLFAWRSPPNGSAARHSCSRRCCWRPARFAYFAANREPSLGSIARLGDGRSGIDRSCRGRGLLLHLAFAALLCFALGMLFAKIETMRAGTKVLGGEISTRLTGRVAVIEHQANGRIRMTIDVLGTERPEAQICAAACACFGARHPRRPAGRRRRHGRGAPRPAVGTDPAGRLRFFLQQLFRRHRRQRLLPDRTRAWPPQLSPTPAGDPLLRRRRKPAHRPRQPHPRRQSAAPRARSPPHSSPASGLAFPKTSTKRCGAPGLPTCCRSPACTWRWSRRRS